MICPVCKREYSGTRKQCPYCARQAQWNTDQKARIAKELFPPRLAHDILFHQYFIDVTWGGLFGCDDLQGLFITGPVGAGKTVLAAKLTMDYIKEVCITNEIVDAGFITVPNILRNLRAVYSGHLTEKEVMRPLEETRWMVLDDLGVEKTSEWNLQILYELINTRYENNLVTIFTSNLSLDDIAQKLGDRIASRISGMAKVLELAGQDFRLKD